MKRTIVNLSNKIILSCVLSALMLQPVVAGDKLFVNKVSVVTNDDKPKTCGKLVQGGLLYGNANGCDVYINGDKISLNDVFVIGLGRDAPDTLKLEFRKKGYCKTFAYPIEKQVYKIQKVNVPKKFRAYPKEIKKRINKESLRIKKVRQTAQGDTAHYFMKLRMPAGIDKYPSSGVFGSARSYNGSSTKSFHKGLDFAAPGGTAVRSAGTGVVILAEDHYMNGKIVIVSHGHGITSHYLHLGKIKVKVGDAVDEKTIVGLVGNSGQSSGAHLHFQINWRQVSIDPKQVTR